MFLDALHGNSLLPIFSRWQTHLQYHQSNVDDYSTLQILYLISARQPGACVKGSDASNVQ
jgi:hypothetical protein